MSRHSFALWCFEIGLGKIAASAGSAIKGFNSLEETRSSFQNLSDRLFPNRGTFRYYSIWNFEQVGNNNNNNKT